MHKRAALVLALALLAVLPAAAETYLLGGAVAEGVVDDEESGLINITGIHAAVYEVDLPYVADLEVYLRWEGEGEHSVVIELQDPYGEVIADVADEVDFEAYATNFTTHSLANTVFGDEGPYTVVVKVDDEETLYLPYVVNDDFGSFGEGPYLLLSVPAVDGWGEDGWAEVEGAFEHYTFARFPGADDFAIVTLWYSGDDTYTQRVEITDPDGKVVATSDEQELYAWPGELVVLTDYFENFLFRTAGDYLVTVYLDGTEYTTYTLRAVLGK